MADAGNVTFTSAGAGRIVKTVRAAERAAPGKVPPPPPPPPSNERFLARLLEADDGGHRWEGVYLKPDGDYEPIDGLTSGDAYSARDYIDGKEAEPETVVWLDFWGYDEDGQPAYRFATGAAGPAVKFGRLKTAWSPGQAVVTLTPIVAPTDDEDAEPPADVSVIIQMPGTTPPLAFANQVDDVLPYMEGTDAEGTAWRFLVNYQPFAPSAYGTGAVIVNVGGGGIANNFQPGQLTAD